jgi:hypothetical protein
MDAHEREGIAAAQGMVELYGERLRGEPAVGDHVNGCSKGRRWSGTIVAIHGRRIDVEIDGGWITVDASDLTF